MGAGIGSYILLVLAPRAAVKFADKGIELPTLTRTVIGISTGLRGSVVLLALLGAVVAVQAVLTCLGIAKQRRGLTIANGVFWGLWIVIAPLLLYAVYLPTL